MMRQLPSQVLTIALVVAPATGDDYQTHDWSQWRGPNHDGVSPERGWLSEGRSSDLWSKKVGMGYSSFAVSDGRAFTMGHDPETSEDRVYCLDAETGEEIWKHSHPDELRATFHGGGTLSTPVVDGDIVYTLSLSGKFFCFSAADGEVRWSKDVNEAFGAAAAGYGYSGSPLVMGERLLICMGGKLVLVDKHTGDALWQSQDYGEGSYSTPVEFDLAGRPALVLYTGKGLAMLDRESGTELCLHPFQASFGVNVASPVVIGSRIFISSAYDMGCAMVDFASGQPQVLWQNKVMRTKLSGCVLWKDHLYGFDESMLKCLDLEGEEKWRVRGLGMGSILASDGRLIIMSSRGELIVADASPREFRELSRAAVLEGGVYWTTPVLCGGRIYCRNSLGDVVCRDHRPQRGLAEGIRSAAKPTAEYLPPAAELFRRHLQAIGGGGALRRHHSVHLQGTVESPSEGETGSRLHIYRLAPNRLLVRHDLGEQFGTLNECYDGSIGWTMHPFFGNKLEEGDRLKELQAAALYYAEDEYEQGYSAMKTAGTAEYGERDCYVVEATTRSGLERKLYFDISTGLLAGHAGDHEAMVVLDDYRDFDGLKLPARRRILKAGTGAEERLLIETVTWDDVEPAVFDPPEPIRWLLMSPEEVEAANAKAREAHRELLGGYLANFQHFENAVFTVTVSHGRLAVDVAGFGVSELDPPDAEGRWKFVNIPALSISFERDAAGAVTAMRFHDFADVFVLPRTEAKPEQPKP